MALNGSFICVEGLGAARYYATLPGAADALVLRILQESGQQDDSLLFGHQTMAALLLGSTGNKECTATGYAPKQITSGATITRDLTNRRVDVDLPDQTWFSLGAMTGPNSGQRQSAVLVSYQPNTSGGTTASEIPLAKLYFPFMADGSDRTVPFPNDLFRHAAG